MEEALGCCQQVLLGVTQSVQDTLLMLIIFLQKLVVSEALSISPTDEVWPTTSREKEMDVNCKRLRWDLLPLGDKVPAKLIFPLLVAHLPLAPHGKFR